MKFLITTLTLAAVVAGFAVVRAFAADSATSAKPEALNFTMKNIDGKDVDLSTYKGKVLLVVNVASKCGNTPQYAGLEDMYAKYKDKGLVVMGFPANNFGSQEPGTDAEIKDFCSATYQVAFPMFSKTSVKGNDINPFYKYLTGLELKPLSKGDVAWNFEKFLIGRDGKVIGRFANKTQPSDPSIVSAVESALAAK